MFLVTLQLGRLLLRVFKLSCFDISLDGRNVCPV